MSTDALVTKLERLQAAHQMKLPPASVTVASDASPDAGPRVVSGRAAVRGRAGRTIIAESQRSLFELECDRGLSGYPVEGTKNHFPSIFTRIPLFPPGLPSRQKALLDSEGSLPFETPWGKGRRWGPLVGIYDEDTYIAISRLRQKGLIGRPDKLPHALTDLTSGAEDVEVHIVECLLSDIDRECEVISGGSSYSRRLNSIRKLDACVIHLDANTAQKVIKPDQYEKLYGKWKGDHCSTKLMDVMWREFDKNTVVYIQFPPLISAWLKDSYSYLDWDLRRRLTDSGKAHHRFFSGQRKAYEIHTEKLKSTIGHTRSYGKYMADLRADLRQLEEEGWLEGWAILGNGRSLPHKLELQRTGAAA